MIHTNQTPNRNHDRVALTLFVLSCISVVAALTDSVRPVSAQSTGPRWSFTGKLNEPRSFASITTLQDGRVLVAGGSGSYDEYVPLASAEIYNPVTGTWTMTGSLVSEYDAGNLTTLADGRVLSVGGSGTEIYDPNAGTWTKTGNPNITFGGHKEVLLLNGKVLMVGGYQSELFDPSTGTWSKTGSQQTARARNTTTLLPNGKVLIVGGTSWFTNPPATLNSAELYDPVTGKWSNTGSLNTAREFQTATLLPNGKVLVTGGAQCNGGCFNYFTSSELYDPATGTWSYTGDLNAARGAADVAPLPDGKILVVGGHTNLQYFYMDSNEVYDSATGTWTYTASANRLREGYAIAPLADGKVLVAGGDGCNSDDCSLDGTAEVYDPRASSNPNQIDDVDFFVSQHYHDFLNRQPDPEGLAFWMNEITSCAGEQGCIEVKRINDSASFFLSIEFQQTGYLVYRIYKASYGNLANGPVPIRFSEFVPDTQAIGKNVVVKQGGWEQLLENNKQIFAATFVQRQRFVSAYPTSLSPDAFVDALFTNAGVTPSSSDRALAIGEFGAATNTTDVGARARAVRRIAENATLAQQEFNRAFVLMQYFGYLRRNPNDAPEATLDFQGYNFWLNKLNSFNGDFVAAEMVKAFLSSNEYRRRFGP